MEKVLYPRDTSDDAQLITTGSGYCLRINRQEDGEYETELFFDDAVKATKEYFKVAQAAALKRSEAFENRLIKATYNEKFFEAYWSAYPRKVGKVVAQRSFMKLKVDEALLEKILSAIEKQKQSEQWKKGIIPNPATWLNQARWEDEGPENTDRPSYDIAQAEAQALEPPVYKKRNK